MLTCKNVQSLCDAYMHNDDNDDTGEARDKLTPGALNRTQLATIKPNANETSSRHVRSC